MSSHAFPAAAPALFSHVTAEKAAFYRAIMDVFAAAKRQFRLHLRADEVLAEAHWPLERPSLEGVQSALSQLTDWGNLQAQPDTARVSTIEDFYRKRLLYRLSAGGEAVEVALTSFVETLVRKGELQSVALDDILTRLDALGQLGAEDAAKVHAALRDLVHVFEGLSNNAEAFMAGLARTVELQRADIAAVMSFKARLIDYLQRFIGDLVTRSGQIADRLNALAAVAPAFLEVAAAREARDAAPGEVAETQASAERLARWQERWEGLRCWFISDGRRVAQSELLRASALAAIPRLLQAVSTLNERRAGRSDRAADFRRLALWFAQARNDAEAHRLWRVAFALSPARHLSIATVDDEAGAGTAWKDAAPVTIHGQLRRYGTLATRGAAPKIVDRSRERALLAAHLAEEAAQTEAARQRLMTEGIVKVSELGFLDRHAFRLFLALLGDALAAQRQPDAPVERIAGDGSLRVRLEPLGAHTHARIQTELGCFTGRDHLVSIEPA
jgi:uncharacterized protein (TIGR02677 family)